MEYFDDYNSSLTIIDDTKDWYDLSGLSKYIYGAPLIQQGTLSKLYNEELILQESGNTASARKNFERVNRSNTGTRLKFDTNSQCLSLLVELEKKKPLVKLTPNSQSGFDIYAKKANSNSYEHITVVAPQPFHNIFYHELTIETYSSILIFFPLYNPIKNIKLGLSKNSQICKSKPYDNENKPLIFYGNSITQGASASRPGNAYPNMVSRMLNCDLINYSFSAACNAELEVVKQISQWNSLGLILDYQYNAKSIDELSNNIDRLYRYYRKLHPKTPIITIDTTLAIMYNKTISEFVKKHNDDKNLYYISLNELFTKYDLVDISVDGTHYGDVGMFTVAERISSLLRPYLNIIGLQP